ncbi:MAG: methyltransferase domain-containing protein [Propionibacteriales bacterium]|nr:methyltransferase domain-containing protein [Propionibacteriales bacterium]
MGGSTRDSRHSGRALHHTGRHRPALRYAPLRAEIAHQAVSSRRDCTSGRPQVQSRREGGAGQEPELASSLRAGVRFARRTVPHQAHFRRQSVVRRAENGTASEPDIGACDPRPSGSRPYRTVLSRRRRGRYGGRVVAIAHGAVRSPNIWESPRVYELENRAADPDGHIFAAMREIRSWAGTTVADIGCGSGFHLPTLAQEAAYVVGVEPHGALLQAARRRCRTLTNVEVRHGAAQRLPIPDASVDVSHARWAYFFGPGCEPGLRELGRVMRHGGVSFVIDNDATRSTFGRWFSRWKPGYDPAQIERFWSRHGWRRRPLDIRWSFANRADFEAVVRIEFSAEHADRVIAEPGLEVDYAVNLWWREW